MTREEARKYLLDISNSLGKTSIEYLTEKDGNKMREAIKALEQEPMQVELTGDGYADGKLVYDYGTCPECGWTFEEDDKDWEEPFCCHCGQKLKWFDKIEESEEK